VIPVQPSDNRRATWRGGESAMPRAAPRFIADVTEFPLLGA
jgi:hypothetical protein